MKRTILAAAVVSVSMLGAIAAHADYKRIASEEQYRALIVGKTLSQGKNHWFIVQPNGALVGKVNGEEFVGAWKWSGKFVCRNGYFKGKDPIGTDCQKIEFDGSNMRLTRKKGKGQSVVYAVD